MKEAAKFSKRSEERSRKDSELNTKLEEVRDELEKLGYKEKVHQTEKNKEFCEVPSMMVRTLNSILVVIVLKLLNRSCSSNHGQ